MEHAYGTAIDVNADRLRSNMMPVASVSAHEFFHLWNVKRIRPQSLEPIDYQSIMDTRALWFSEGVTSTVGDMLLARAGLYSDRQYIDRIASEINELQSRPAHRWQSVEESSLDAWFEGDSFYRTPERSISYYNKGEVVGVLLDLRIRQLTGGRKSLRDLFQWMNENYAKKGRFFPDSDGVQQAAETITGQSFARVLPRLCGWRAASCPTTSRSSSWGCRWPRPRSARRRPVLPPAPISDGQPEVMSVDANSEAQRAGIAIGDRVVEVDGKPATASLDDQFARMRAGTTVKIRVREPAWATHRQAETIVAGSSRCTSSRMSPRSRPNNLPIAWPGFTATMKLAVGRDPHGISPDVLGTLAPDQPDHSCCSTHS